jgi:hypothetical protein
MFLRKELIKYLSRKMRFDNYQDIKRFIILSFFVSITFLSMIISGCDDLMGDNGDIFAERIFENPQSYINLTLENIEKYPHLREALNQTGQHIETPRDEWYALKDFFGDSFKYIYYQERYYYVRLFGFV